MLDRHALVALSTAIARGDGAAFQNLYDDRAAAVFGLALRITGHADGATEALQHTFVEVWRALKAGDGTWDAPDLDLFGITRRKASDVLHRHGRSGDDAANMTDPVRDGTASFELLKLLQTLGQLSQESRNTLTMVYFDCPKPEDLAGPSGASKDEADQTLRRCYAELRAVDPPNPPILDRDADMLAMRQALGLAGRSQAADQAAIEAWERALAPFGELIAPVAPPDGAFASIMDRVNATASIETVEGTGRKAEIWRAGLYVAVAGLAAVLIYFALVAIGDDAAARTLIP